MITITPNAPMQSRPQDKNGTQRFGNAPQGVNTNNVNNNQARQNNFFQPFRAYRQGGNGPVVFDPEFDGKRLRKSAMRKTVDYNAAIIKMLESRVWQRDYRDRRALQPDAMYIPDLMPPSCYEDNPINAVTTRFVKTATNKMRCPIFCMAWTPEGRRLVTGASSGEFTLWNGLTFNFETILQAHDTPVRTMVWSHNEMWMVTADHAGYVKYWQSNMNNVKMFLAHQEAIRGISFSPMDSKFASCSDDGTIKIWDFFRCQEERTLRGHGADVKCVHWHPQKGLIISGSKDNQQPVKLWDPKTGTSLATIHAHKSTVMDVKWNNNGNWFVTASRDHLLKLFDIRNLNSEVQVFRGHKKESSSVAWHPIHEGLFCSGGSDGAILFWHVGAEKEVGAIEQAHDSIVWTLAWHPMGHILCSGSNDHTSKFWTRNRPGDTMRDKYNLNTLPASMAGLEETEIEEAFSVIPGMGPEDKVELNTNSTSLPGLNPGTIPGLEDIDLNEDKNKLQSKKVPYSKPIPKNFQAQWNDTGKLEDLDDDSKDGIDPMSILNQLIEQQPGVKLVKDLEPEALMIYGKTLPVEPGSTLAKVIMEGGEKLMKYLNSGAVKELRDVIPHYDENDTEILQRSDEDDIQDLGNLDADMEQFHLDLDDENSNTNTSFNQFSGRHGFGSEDQDECHPRGRSPNFNDRQNYQDNDFPSERSRFNQNFRERPFNDKFGERQHFGPKGDRFGPDLNFRNDKKFQSRGNFNRPYRDSPDRFRGGGVGGGDQTNQDWGTPFQQHGPPQNDRRNFFQEEKNNMDWDGDGDNLQENGYHQFQDRDDNRNRGERENRGNYRGGGGNFRNRRGGWKSRPNRPFQRGGMGH